MKKRSFIFLVVAIIAAIVLGACNTAAPVPEEDVPSYEDGMRDQCFELGGLLDKDANCVLVEAVEAKEQPAAVMQQPVSAPPVQSEFQEQPVAVMQQPVDEKLAYCMQYTATFGKMGKFHAVYDSNLQTCVLGAWESNRVDQSQDWGYTLANLKETGDDYVFLNPWKGKLNHSAEFVFIDSEECTPANPVRCMNGVDIFPKGSTIRIISQPGNDSSGPFLIMVP